ncbi:MAG: PAS domain S-box protein [Bacteroidales bacterium]|nr:PAS domain S-box protein [Bacteroidales bacterium]MCF8388574.1 PAS domain S-box protein [Bacteroidales bacterium]MCF8396693.1 PAS domain S-box protein [Bacteroidales bacterium]
MTVQQEILDIISEPISLVDKNYAYVFVNKAYCDFFGKTYDEIIGRKVEVLVGEQNFKEKVKPHFERCLQGEKVQYINVIPYGVNEDDRFLLVNYYPHRNESGEVDGVISTVKDITREVILKNDWLNTIHALDDILIVISRDFEILDVNQNALDLLSKERSELVGRKCYEVIHCVDEPGDFCPLIKSKESHKPEYVERYEPLFEKYFSIKSAPVFNQNGQIIKYVDLMRDISELKKSEEYIKDQNDELAALNEEYQTSNEELLASNEKLQKFYSDLQETNTQKSKAQKSLQLEKDRYLSLFENSLIGIGLGTPEGDILECNRAFAQILGYEKGELINEKLADLYENPEERIKIKNLLDKEGVLHNFETRLKKKDGNTINVILNISVIQDGKNIYYQTTCLDISEKIQADERIASSENKFRSLVEQAAEMLFLHDLDGNIIEVNNAAVKNTGYSKEELLSMTVYDIDPDAEHRSDRRKYWLRSLKIGDSYSFDASHVRKDGSVYPVNITLSKITMGGQEFVLALANDISERKKAEEIQSVIYNISNATLKTLNIEDLVIFIENELSTLIDTKNYYITLYDQESKKLSLPFFQDERDHFTSFPEGKTLTHYIIRTGKSLFANQAKIKELEEANEIEKYGSDSLLWLGVPLFVKGKVTGALVLQSYDDKNAFTESDLKLLELISGQIGISIERKKYEEDLFKALEQAKESDRLKSAFLANMSHEIRTPMNGILGFTDLLSEHDYSAEEKKKYIDIIRKSGERLITTINDLIDISRIESGQVNINLSESNIDEHLNDIFQFFKPEAEKKGLRLNVFEPGDKLDIILETDKDKLHSILSNLVKNAIKFTEQGSITIGYHPYNEWIEFFVQDTGVGIAKERQKAVFDRFVQADLAHTRPYEGSGLGLSITKAYTEMLGGKISLNSELGQGTTFFVKIPRKVKSKTNLQQDKDNLNLDGKTKLGILDILVVEDEEYARMYLNDILKNKCKNLLMAKNGKEAVEICRKNKNIDIILMDIKMPVMDGYMASREIRKFNQDVVIIAQTAYALQGDREKALAAGCNDYIAKPINRKELFLLIQKLIEKQ